jgi:carbon storage regulator
MLIISRKKDEKIIVADDIEITILEVGRNRVRFGIKAPRDVAIQTRLKTTPEAVPEAAKEAAERSAAVEAPRQDLFQREMSAGANSSKTS